MTTLLPSATATGSTATEGDVKTFLDNIRTFMADLLGTDSTNKGAALAALGALLNGTSNKSSAYTVSTVDRGKVINCTGAASWTISMQAAATLGDGFVFAVANNGTGVITLDPNLAELVNGLATFPIAPTETVIIYCNGTEFFLFGKAAYPGRGQQVFTSSGTFAVPLGVKSVKVTCIGAGGGGGSVSTLGTYAGSGGGAGGVAIKTVSGFVYGDTVSVTVAGTAAAAAAGGASSFGAHCTGNGGSAGTSNVGGTTAGNGGAGGSGTGDRVASAIAGSPTITDGSAQISSGAGASQVLAGVYGGLGGAAKTANGAGANGVGFGSGGSGAFHTNSTPYSGGTGSPGLVVVEW
jgi:hypothetical protein